MKRMTLPYYFTEPPARLKKVRLDNIALVPASLLKNKAIWESQSEKGGSYRGTYDKGLVQKYNFSLLVRTLDPFSLSGSWNG